MEKTCLWLVSYLTLKNHYIYSEEKAMIKAFKMYDKGGHNSISYDEVKQSMTIIGEKHYDKEIDNVIKEADTDGDGEISFEEFKAVL